MATLAFSTVHCVLCLVRSCQGGVRGFFPHFVRLQLGASHCPFRRLRGFVDVTRRNTPLPPFSHRFLMMLVSVHMGAVACSRARFSII